MRPDTAEALSYTLLEIISTQTRIQQNDYAIENKLMTTDTALLVHAIYSLKHDLTIYYQFYF